ncbi:MAG: WapI family immunity protein [Mycobacteriaceae bacterium]
MRLESHNGAVVEVTPLRYQFGASPEPRDWDANWLYIATRVELPDGRSWLSTDPCLTTWEARELGAWLEGVHAGDLQPTEFGGEDDERLLVFTEPNLGFSLARRDDETVTIRVHFSLESRPPWLRDDDEADLFGYFVEVDLAIEGVAAAATTWSEELAAFPVR